MGQKIENFKSRVRAAIPRLRSSDAMGAPLSSSVPTAPRNMDRRAFGKLLFGGGAAVVLAACGVGSKAVDPLRGSSTFPDGSPRSGGSPTPTPDRTETFPVITPDMAASLLGASSYSRKPSNWDVVRYLSNDGRSVSDGLHLKPSDAGFHTRVHTKGLPWEGYLDLKDGGELSFFQDGVRAITLVINGEALPDVDLRGGTGWAIQPRESMDISFPRLWTQVNDKEHGPISNGGQPGALVVPVGEEACLSGSTKVDVRTREQAAKRFGADEYTSNHENWEVIYDDPDVIGIHLIPDKSGQHHRVDNMQGVVYEGYWDVNDDGEVPFFKKGVRAITFVGNGSIVPTMDMRGGSFWIPKNEASAGNLAGRARHLLSQVTVKETGPVAQGGQSGGLIYPLGINPKGDICVFTNIYTN